MMWTFVATVFSKATIADWLVLSVALLLLLYIWGTWNYDYFHKRGIHYIKPKLPFVGNTTSPLFGVCAFHDMVDSLYKQGEGHSAVGMFEFRRPILMVRDPELLKTVAVKDFDHFVNHRTFESLAVEPLFLNNLFNLKDDHWRRMRATISPAFTTSKMKRMFPLTSQCAAQMVANLRERYETGSQQGGRNVPMEVDMKDVFTRMANDVIASAAFGIQCDSLKDKENEFYRMGKKLTTFSGLQMLVMIGSMISPKLMLRLGVRFFDAVAVDFFDSLVHETIRERQKKGIFRPDVLQLLMQARQGELLQAEHQDKDEATHEEGEEEEEEKGDSWKSNLRDDDIAGQLLVFFAAGFDTIAATLFFMSYALSFNPQQQTRLQKEVDDVFKATGGKPTYEAVQQMKYLDAVVNETMRLYPANPATDRQCNEDTVLPATQNSKAIRIPKGMIISIPVIGLHYDPEYWTDPMTFNPDRFLDENKHNIRPFTYMPFGVGPRICIAQRFALLELKIAFFHLLRQFDLHPSPKLKYPIEFKKGIIIGPQGGFLCCFKPRQT